MTKSILAQVKNLSEFSRKSGIPLRTLQRIKTADASRPMSPVTKVAIEAAMKKHKPPMKEQA